VEDDFVDQDRQCNYVFTTFVNNSSFSFRIIVYVMIVQNLFEANVPTYFCKEPKKKIV
jgi:hypothetical protein